MFQLHFELNDQALSALKLGPFSYPAFSGLAPHVNKRHAGCLANAGPVPPGLYYILDRESGGLLGPLRDRISNRSEWFALYAVDQKIDDYTYCNEVERGNFRLHPKGPSGISKGCIVLEKQVDFFRLRACLESASPTAIPGSKLKAYGKLWVR
ncbi:DUF2778 domain-containing protein [Noviherbaspirillum sp. CPCC 100848]|uniref:DUF2778 domain-containing protein n=1 Tax=Noviherbaspirillum album TaxID=3080276 RepID=A0ABU6J3S9_9BURK|nr:DUF2778 domain-containing protein [Noviherbaspirillum sp. CPCC 100848]MEC4717869.1 DUF2778 domain-containing protein [Noviherbaspirillum sp. CPCC 100848]